MHTSSPSRNRNSIADSKMSVTASPRRNRDSVYSGSSLPAPSAVGEFKGWFANLFNWKAQQYVLHSVDNCATTREEVKRLLEGFGVEVRVEKEDVHGWGVLKCKVDEQYGMSVL